MEKLSNQDFNEKLYERTKQFALQIISLNSELLAKKSAHRQLLCSTTSVAVNFRTACHGRSKQEFYSKICIAVGEADKTRFWFEMLQKVSLIKKSKVKSLLNEVLTLSITGSIKAKLRP